MLQYYIIYAGCRIIRSPEAGPALDQNGPDLSPTRSRTYNRALQSSIQSFERLPYPRWTDTRFNFSFASPPTDSLLSKVCFWPTADMALDKYFQNKIEKMKLDIIQGQAVLRRLEAQRNDYNSRVRLLREELGLLQQPGSYVGEVVKVMGTKKVLVKVHPEGKYGRYASDPAGSTG